MKVKLLAFWILLAVTASALGQPVQWNSYTSNPGPGVDIPTSLAICPEGGYYVLTGSEESSRLARYTSTGMLMWEIPVPGSATFFGPTFNNGMSSQDPMTPVSGGVLLTTQSILSNGNTSFSFKVDDLGHMVSMHAWPCNTTVYVDAVGNQYAAVNNGLNSYFEKLNPSNNVLWKQDVIPLPNLYGILCGIVDSQAVSVEEYASDQYDYESRFSLGGTFEAKSSPRFFAPGFDDATGHVNLGDCAYNPPGWYPFSPSITGSWTGTYLWFNTFGSTLRFTDGIGVGTYSPATFAGFISPIYGITPGTAKAVTVDPGGTSTVGAALKNENMTQAVISRVNNDGTPIWQSFLGGGVVGADSYCNRVVTAPDQSVVALSELNDIPNMGKHLALTGHDQTNGHVLWRNDIYHRHTSNLAMASATDAQGNTYVLGMQIYGDIPFGASQLGGQEVDLEKINVLGVRVWNKVVATSPFLAAIDVNVTSDGCELIYGKYATQQLVFSKAGGQVYEARYTSDGALAWSQLAMNSPGWWVHAFGPAGTTYFAGTTSFGSPTAIGVMSDGGQLTWGPAAAPEPQPQCMIVDRNGYAYLAAFSQSNVGGSTYKYDPAGNVLWRKQFTQSPITDIPYLIQLGPNDEPYVLSGMSDSTGATTDDWTLRHLDANGNLLYQYSRNDIGPVALAIDKDGEAYLETIVYSNGLLPNDQVVTKLASDGSVDWATTSTQTDVDADGHTKLLPINYRLLTDSDDSVYMVARTQGALARDCNYAVIKYLANGLKGWPASGGGFSNGVFSYESHNLDDSIINLAMDSIGNLYLTGISTGPSYDYELNVMKFGPVSSQFTSQSIPSTMTAGQSYAVTVTLTNNGTSVWTSAGGYSLTCLNGALWSRPTVTFASTDSIAPGQSKKFSFTVIAPTTGGTYPMQWCLQQNGVLFGAPTPLVSVPVSVRQNAALYISQSVLSTVKAGSSFTVTVTMRNVGTTTWTSSAGQVLASTSPDMNTVWGLVTVPLLATDSIPQGSQKSFTFTCKAPATAGAYSIRWRMYRSAPAFTGFFGDTTSARTITVTP